MKFKAKFGLFSIVLVIASVILISSFIVFRERQTLIKNMEEHRLDVFESLKTLSKEALFLHDEILFINYANSIKKSNKEVLYVLFTYLGDIDRVLYAARKRLSSKDILNEIPKVDFKEYDEKTFSNSYKSRVFGNVFEMSTLLNIRGQPLGILRLGFSQDILNKNLAESFKSMLGKIIVGSIIAITGGVIFSFVLSASLTKPIYNLSKGAKELGKGNLEKRIEVISKDELGELTQTFNKMAEALQELDQLKDDFVNSVSHELRSPLSAIEGYIDYLQEGLRLQIPKDKQEKALRIMKDSSVRLSNFITSILDLAKIKAKRMEVNNATFDIRAAAREIVELFEPKAKEQGVTLKCEFEQKLPKVFADVGKIKQVFTNLISNALKFTKEGGVITVFCQEDSDEGFLRCGVSDTGVGMSKEDAKKVFGKFYQVKRKEKTKGTGLGLAIVKGIVDLHKGKIWCESEVGKGTAFIFTIPVSKKKVKHNGEEDSRY